MELTLDHEAVEDLCLVLHIAPPLLVERYSTIMSNSPASQASN